MELALHLYRLPRLTKLWTHLERQSGAAGSGGGKSGGVGLRGPGERQLEVDRRLLKEKITDLQRALLQVRRHRALHRRRREALGLPVVALVGQCSGSRPTFCSIDELAAHRTSSSPFDRSHDYLRSAVTAALSASKPTPMIVQIAFQSDAGYTNAGKSTVLNALTSAGVLAEDMLFATLDPTTRRVKLPGLKVHPEIMFTGE